MFGFEIKCLINNDNECMDVLTSIVQAVKYSGSQIIVIADSKVVYIDIIEERNNIILAITDVKPAEDYPCDEFAVTSDMLYTFLATTALEILCVKLILR